SASVWLPAQAYGDYRRAAEAWGLPVFTYEHSPNADDMPMRQGVGAGAGQPTAQGQEPSPSSPRLIWACDPSSPLGQTPALRAWWGGCDPSTDVRVLDAAYAPLRLSGQPALLPDEARLGWLLVTPNKALGLTGIRAAYLVAPDAAVAEVGLAAQLMARLHQLSSSWPIGTHGVALLHAWADPVVRCWLAAARDQLREWKTMQIEGLQRRGWTVLPSEANHFCARPPIDSSNLVGLLARLRSAGIKLRDARSFGLSGWVRLGVRTPADQQALWQALDQFGCTQGA
ncbi:MAG: aminotransferase class I/II-fold pyridoxal phosphate-dependent enzyme, partial [Lautropia sp.]|nr:aminotransferase class I/II-fold pyridoxal phosphate-dependent enzyme [Lautropia sp.]